MRWRGELAAFVRRVDVPLSLVLAQAITLLVLALLLLLFALASHEASEVLEQSLESDLRRVAMRVEQNRRLDDLDAGVGVAIRLLAGGEARVLMGEWPTRELYDDSTSSVRLA